MRKGFVLSIVFAFIFAIVLGTVLSYSDKASEGELLKAGDPTLKKAFVRDDIAFDLKQLMGVNVSIEKTASSTEVSFADSTPSNLSNPSQEETDYIDFAEGDYADATNSEISLNPSPQIIVSPAGLTYSYSGWGKDSVTLEGEADELIVVARINDSCATDCSTATTYSWKWASSGLKVKLDLRDANGAQIMVNGSTSGFVDPSESNLLSVALAGGGSFDLSTGGSSQPKLSFSSDAPTLVNTTAVLPGTSPATVSVDAGLVIDGESYEYLPILQK